MKKTLKNIVVCICIIYFILSLTYSIIYKGFYEESMAGYESDTSILSKTDKINTTADILMEHCVGSLEILDEIIAISVISIVAGVIMGMLKSIEENSVIRYIVIFVFGFLMYYIICKTILVLNNKTAYGIGFWYYLNVDVKTFVWISISYILFYLAGILSIFVINKIKVNSLNKTLVNSTTKINENFYKNVKRIIIGILIIFCVVFVSNITRKSIILINYSKKINELSNCNNYYEKKTIKTKNQNGGYDTLNQELYCKNGVRIYKIGHAQMDFYDNERTKEYFLYSVENKEFMKLKDNSVKGFYLNDSYFTDSNVRIWGNIVLSLNVKIYSEKLEDKDCYVIQNGNVKNYIDKNTYLIKRSVVLDVENKDSEVVISDYDFEFGNITDENVKRPDIINFKELENETEK